MSRLGVVQGLGDVVGEDLGEESSQDSEEESGLIDHGILSN